MSAANPAPVKRRTTPGVQTTQVSMRMHNDVLRAYRAIGRGWQTRMNDVLRAAIPHLARTESERLERIASELTQMAERLREHPRNAEPLTVQARSRKRAQSTTEP